MVLNYWLIHQQIDFVHICFSITLGKLASLRLARPAILCMSAILWWAALCIQTVGENKWSFTGLRCVIFYRWKTIHFNIVLCWLLWCAVNWWVQSMFTGSNQMVCLDLMHILSWVWMSETRWHWTHNVDELLTQSIWPQYDHTIQSLFTELTVASAVCNSFC